jgi:hypothetical protein
MTLGLFDFRPAASHSFYFEDKNVLNDLAYTLDGSIDRNVIPTRRATASPDDFVLIQKTK